MKKRMLICALLCALALLLCACSPQEDDPANTGNDVPGQAAPMEELNAGQRFSLPDGYDPASEEDNGSFNASAAYDAYGNQIYAGATPIPIQPIDMPTATPRPELTFSYGDYTATRLGITFKSAVGYTINESSNNVYILTEPDAAVKDNVPCVITLQISPITASYNQDDVKKDLSAYLDALGMQYTQKWETWTAASKTLMGGKGYYNNYRGELSDGTIVRGRVHMAIISNNQLLTLHITCPGWFNSSYMKIYDTIRDTIKPLN